MGKIQIILQGTPYKEPCYYGKIEWNENNVYIKHLGGGKDSRHQDGFTYLTSTEENRLIEQRVQISDIGREFINYITLPSTCDVLPAFRSQIHDTDLILQTNEVGETPCLAVEIVNNERVEGVINAWATHSTAPNVIKFVDKGLDQTLVIAIAGTLKAPPST